MTFQDVEPEETSEFRNDSFVDTIINIEMIPKTINEDIKDMVVFTFESGAPLELFPPRDGWGDVKGYEDIGRVINDLKKTGIKFQVDPDAMMIRTVPSIIGAKASFKCSKKEKTVRGEVRTYTNWSIENISLPDVDNTAANSDNDDELLDQVIKDIEIILGESPQDMRGIIRGYSTLVHDREERIPRIKLKEKAIGELIDNGLVEKKDGLYHFIG